MDKTPTIFSGLKPYDKNFEEQFYSWTKEERMKYLEYFERDITKVSMFIGCFWGIIIGIIITCIYFIFV